MQYSHKEYEHAFLLEPTKLTRILDAIHLRLDDDPNSIKRDEFTVFLSGHRRDEFESLEEVLALDNSKRRKIHRLSITCSAATRDASRPEYEVQVDFGLPVSPRRESSHTNVAVNVRGKSGAWVGRTLSEVEEQVERTWLNQLRPEFFFILLFSLVFIAISLLFTSTDRAGSDAFWLSEADQERIAALLADSDTLSADDLRYVRTLQLRSVIEEKQTGKVPLPGLRNTLLIGGPLLVVIACLMVLFTTCYPTKVFLWGDEVDRYERIIQRRRVLWTVIVGGILVGVLATLLSEGISSWIGKVSAR